MEWQLQEAKSRFGELVDRSLKEGPQTVTRNGKAVAVVVPIEEYKRLKKRDRDFKQFLASAPLEGVEIKRSDSSGRIVDFDVPD